MVTSIFILVTVFSRLTWNTGRQNESIQFPWGNTLRVQAAILWIGVVVASSQMISASPFGLLPWVFAALVPAFLLLRGMKPVKGAENVPPARSMKHRRAMKWVTIMAVLVALTRLADTLVTHPVTPRIDPSNKPISRPTGQ
jgi:uncharacterized phage infection (PIP) family protein YhgE